MRKRKACLRTFLEEIKQAKRILKKMTFFKNRLDFNKKVRRQAQGNQYHLLSLLRTLAGGRIARPTLSPSPAAGVA